MIPTAASRAISSTVTPDDYGKVAVRGRIVSSSAQTIAIARHDETAGDIVVHFPRAGFLLTPVAAWPARWRRDFVFGRIGVGQHRRRTLLSATISDALALKLAPRPSLVERDPAEVL